MSIIAYKFQAPNGSYWYIAADDQPTIDYWKTRRKLIPLNDDFARSVAATQAAERVTVPGALSSQDIEKLAVKHEDFGFGQVDAQGFTTHGFSPEGLAAFVAELLAATPPQQATPCPYCTSDNDAVRSTFFDQTCTGCMRRTALATPPQQATPAGWGTLNLDESYGSWLFPTHEMARSHQQTALGGKRHPSAIVPLFPAASTIAAAQPDALLMALAHLRWHCFGECRTPGWDGPPPTSTETEAVIRAALATRGA